MQLLQSLSGMLYRPFRLDLRALALMRMGMGGLLLLDLLFRLPDLRAHYGNGGVLPLAELFLHFWNPWRGSLHTATGLWQGQLVLFGVAGCAALALALGWRTRWATLVSWLLLLSLHNRNPFVLQGGDDLLRLLLFWGLFMPWSARWSLDALRRPQPAGPIYTGAAGVGYVLLGGSVYFFSALLKTGPEWTEDYTALYYALSLDQIVLPLGELLYPYPELLKTLTFLTWWAELLLPLLLLVPVRSYWPRLVFILCIAGLHLGIAASLYVGLFFLIGWTSLLGMLPPPVLDKVERWARLGAVTWHNRFSHVRFPALYYLKKTAPNRLLPQHPLLEGALFGTVLYCLFWNLNNTPGSPVGMPYQVQWLGQVLRLDQNWGMFAPAVFKDDGWYIFEGKTKAGQLLDLNQNGRPVQYQKPDRIVAMYSSDRWRKYYEYNLFVSFSFLRPPHCRWALNTWNKKHPTQKVQELNVVYMKEVTLPDYKVDGPKREVLCTCTAF